jgi:hypothetical protein
VYIDGLWTIRGHSACAVTVPDWPHARVLLFVIHDHRVPEVAAL